MNLKFGTGGLRATMGPGPDHMNLETIQEATLGVAAYAKEQSDHPSAALALSLIHIYRRRLLRRQRIRTRTRYRRISGNCSAWKRMESIIFP